MGLRFKKDDVVILTSRLIKRKIAFQFVGQIHRTDYAEYLGGEWCWNFSPPLRTADGREVVWPDFSCDPIEDKPGDDETLTWAGKPAPVVRKLSEPEFDAACDRWIQGVEA